jgi:hypothetical protein
MTRVSPTGDVYVDDLRAGRVRKVDGRWLFVAVGSARSSQCYETRAAAVEALTVLHRRMREVAS